MKDMQWKLKSVLPGNIVYNHECGMSEVCQVKVDVYAQGGEDWEGAEKEEDQLGEESEQADEDITANILKSGLIASLATWYTYSKYVAHIKLKFR